MMILTFVPRPLKRAETRQLSQGITFSLRWDMWGHTLSDLAMADTRMTQPWATLRALGLYKPKDADWGIDYLSGAAIRAANKDNGFRLDELENFIEGGGFKFLPKFLHGEIDEEDDYDWEEYCLKTIVNVENFLKRTTLYCFGGYVTLQVLILLVGVVAARGDKEGRSFKRFYWALVRVALIQTLVYIAYKAAVNRVDTTEWARDIRARRLYAPPFGNEENDYWGPTTSPHRKDVLIETRYKSEHLAMYNDFVAGHPGNREWNEWLEAQAPIYASYVGSPMFRDAVAEYVVGAVNSNGGRMLYQGPDSHWIVMSKEDSVTQTELELRARSSSLLFEMNRVIDFLKSDCKYGRFRSTSLARSDSYAFLYDLKERLGLIPKRSESLVKPVNTVLVTLKRHIAPAFPRLFNLQTPSCKARFERRPVALHVGQPPQEPELGAWLMQGDKVDGYYKEPSGRYMWYPGSIRLVTSSGFDLVDFADGDEAWMWHTQVRRYRPLQPGEMVEAFLNDDYQFAEVIKEDLENGTCVLQLSSGQKVKGVSTGGLIRPT
jgi:hypothetical protein